MVIKIGEGFIIQFYTKRGHPYHSLDGGKGAVGCVLRGWLVFVGRHGVGLLSEKMMETKRDIKRVVRIAFSARAWVKFGAPVARIRAVGRVRCVVYYSVRP